MTMIPRYSNPSALLQSTAIVSRSALNGDSDDEASLAPPAADAEHARMVARLENILKRSIADVLPQVHAEEDEERSRKKRKRKEDSTEEGSTRGAIVEQVAVSFRLFSGTAQPKPILLVPKPQPQLISQGPAVEDTKAEAKRRARRAHEAAVDSEWIMNESRKPPVPSRRKERIQHIITKLPDTSSTLLVLERPKAAPKPPQLALVKPDAEVKPSPHEHCADCCPVIQVNASPETPSVRRERRRSKRKSRNTKPAIQPAFWRPPPGLVGKCLGYAWGYSGSRPLLPDEPPHYERDKMKKAEYE
ncbi:hypothetical protein C8Q80DRAFT_1119835 [Daedaleopsis nitida]|nr:hypothetical protein C8Q80DRAFT_1119835 [Daedaleopsis nitida]